MISGIGSFQAGCRFIWRRNGVALIPASRRVSSLRQGGSMYLALAYGLVAFTILVVLWLLWLGWENRRDQVRAERERKLPATISE
jgi:hypothetical protein